MKWINLLLLLLVIYLFTCSSPVRESQTQTIIYRDTIRDTVPKLVTKYITRYDTVLVNDTQFVYLPISTYEYKDTNYRIVVEGYQVKPLLIETYPITKVIREKKVRFAPIIGVGAIYGTKGLDVGIIAGVGVTFQF